MSSNQAKITVAASPRDVFVSEDTCARCLHIWWLGQAGFALLVNGTRILIDPYLSDSLAFKYAGTDLPHLRMMAPPIQPEKLERIDFVLCTHHHTDHMDPGTLPAIFHNNPQCRFIVPRASMGHANAHGLLKSAKCPMNAGDFEKLNETVSVKVIPSAHESLIVDEDGYHYYLGYILITPNMKLYHSGDCVPYDGLKETLFNESIDIALLPVNGRDEYRSSKGIPGNFTVQEAIGLCKESGIHTLIPHHFGMFDFNTVRMDFLKNAAEKVKSEMRFIIPEINVMYTFGDSCQSVERRAP